MMKDLILRTSEVVFPLGVRAIFWVVKITKKECVYIYIYIYIYRDIYIYIERERYR